MAQDVFSEMAIDPWLLNEDGYLNVNTNIKEIVYHPSLNVILISSTQGTIHVLDVNSGVILLSSSLAANNKDSIQCKYIPGQDRILFTDGETIGVRSDYNGVLLLDSILQKTVSKSKESIKLELPLSEAIILKQSLNTDNLIGIDHVINELTEVIQNAQKQSKKGIKAQKWNTVCLTLPIDIFQFATSSAVSEMIGKNLHTPELGVASAVHERLSELLGRQANSTDKKSMASESRRRETFSQWPHMDYKWALPDQMAQAGFYHQPNNSGDDRAMCFTCTVCLVCWERSDEPWSEHERHSPNCPFVMGEYTQNVPLSVTHATNPAADATYRGAPLALLGSSGAPELVPAAYPDSLVSVFDVSGKVERTHSFYVTQFDSHILERITLDFGSWRNDDRKYPIVRKITALSIVGELDKASKSESFALDKEVATKIRPSIICGLFISCAVDKSAQKDDLNDWSMSSDTESNLYLVVYDFTYKKEMDLVEVEKPVKEITSSNSTLDNMNEMDSTLATPNNIINLNQMLDNLDADSFMKHIFSYKTFIPDDKNAIHIPPSVTKSHSGPKLLPMPPPLSETDSAQGNSFGLCDSIPEISEVSSTISEHIKELKNSKSQNKLNYSHSVQCVSLPSECKNISDLEITHILPNASHTHILVVVSSVTTYKSFLLLYELDFTQKMVKILETPALIRQLEPNEKPVEVKLLPNLDKIRISAENRDGDVEGNAILVCLDGAVRIVELRSLNTACFAKLENESFLSATYCNSLERLCVSTKGGSLHFYALNETDNESLDDLEDEDLFGAPIEGGAASSQPPPDATDADEARCFDEPAGVVRLEELKRLHALCDFEPLRAGYCAVVPPCWSDIQQALRQRKHPIKPKAEGEQYAKTWRLQTDTTTWDEHVFEISLPSGVALGHVDVHCRIQHSALPPQVEFTLLRQNSKGIGHKRDVKFGVDESITIDMLQWADNPVISQEYLRAHNAEILAGPININEHLDLLEQTATVTLTSPKIFRSKCRTLLLHVKSVSARDDKQKDPLGANADKGASRNGNYMGCDCIHELSITLFTSKHTEVQNERSQRNFMLESNVFVQSLFLTATQQCTVEVLGYVLDVVNWVAAIRLSRNRSNNGDAPNHQMDFINAIQNSLQKLMEKCLLHGGRSIAHKCMKLLSICCSGANNIHESVGANFNQCVLNILLPLLDNIGEVRSAAGLQWIFAVLFKVTSKDKERSLSSKLIEVLGKLSDEINKRANPYHLLLRARYGLYGTPMEPELFDVDLPSHIKGSNSPTYHITSAGVGETASNHSEFFANYSYNKESISAKDVLFNADTKLKYKNIAPPKTIKGLIETVPLHFTCISASEGTRLERADVLNGANPNSMVQLTSSKEDIQQFINSLVGGVNDDSFHFLKRQDSIPESLFDNFNKSIKHSGTGGACSFKEDRSSPCSLPWQRLLTPPAQQVMVVERMHSGARRHVTLDFGRPVLLTDVVIPSCADLVSVSVDIWMLGEEVDETRLAIASDIGTRNLLLNDLQPPPLCRYMKITGIGRYGMSTTRCRIPTGYFYGHIIVLPEEVPSYLSDQSSDIACKDADKQLNILSNLLEDINCRYSLACSKLKDLLQPCLVSDLKNAENLFTYIGVMRDISANVTDWEHSKIFNSYQDAIGFQLQLNTVKHVMWRLEESLNRTPQNHGQGLSNCSTDKLRSIAEGIIEVLLSLDTLPNLHVDRCRQLFNSLCVCQTSRLQLLAALFLDKSCGRNSFWGDFLADTLYTMYSTDFTVKFPQDRLFVLLNFLSRRTPERSSVIDAALRVVYKTLNPAVNGDLADQDKTLLAISTDLPLLSWLLMYLSLQLDLATPPNSTNRWNFVFGELVEKSNVDNAKPNSRKMFKCKRAIPTSPGVIASYVPKSTSSSVSFSKQFGKLGTYWKTNELMLKADKFKLKISKKAATELAKHKENVETTSEKARKVPQHISKLHCQIVAKSLMQFILSMDHSSSADIMLLAFKVVARLVSIAKLQLGQLISEEDMLRLINLTISSKMSWSTVALTCFLEDAMDLAVPHCEDAEMETINSSSARWYNGKGKDNFGSKSPQSPRETKNIWIYNDSIPDIIANVDALCDVQDTMLAETISKQPKPNTSTSNNGQNNIVPLPSVFESDDSELEEILEEFDKVQRSVKKPVKTTFRSNLNISTSIDSRLELGVTSSSEINIKKMLIKNTEILFNNISTGLPLDDNEVPLRPWARMPMPRLVESSTTNQIMLTNCFEKLFENLQLKPPSHIEEIVNFWLTLNNTDTGDRFDSSAAPKIILNPESVKALVSALAWTTGLSLTTWCTSLQALSMVCNTNVENPSSHWPEIPGMAPHIVDHPDFMQCLLRLLSGSGLAVNGNTLAGPTLCRALHNFLVRLEMRCDIVSPTSMLGISIKNLLLKVVYQLIQPLGPITARQGPLDAQCKLLQNMLQMNFVQTDLTIAMSILESTGVFVQSYVENVDKIKCINIGEKQNTTTSTFSDIFASVLGSDSNKSDRPVSYEVLQISLLRLLGKLIETPLPNTGNKTGQPNPSTSQTDESKAEQIQEGSRTPDNVAPCFADVVLRHHPCFIRLCHALSSCKSSSLCMLVNVAPKASFANFGEPTTVGDAVFQVLATLAKKATSREMLMEPLLIFLSQTPSLSEPLLWFILQVLDTQEAVRCFHGLGGITILAKSVVESSNAPSTIAKMGMISTVMQHFTGSNLSTDLNTFISASSASKKSVQASLENKLALVNFAPHCTVRCLSGTAQPADVLIQGLGGVTHRRARTPLWSYHFYPDEAHTELLLQLPSAVLLKEVQLQPHTIGLATCPSAVALEISASGPSRLVPACAPIQTSGMTYIRLHLPTPTAANCVLIRLYKPRDAQSIGLLQIRLLGNTAYGQTVTDSSEDESHCRHSLGWLRLLHHCFVMPTDRDLRRQVIGGASSVSQLLSCCCGLLLVPSHILPVYVPCLERILRELALHSPENGIVVIRVLLNNKPGIIEPLQTQTNVDDRHLVNSTSDFSACELLYQICEHEDDNTYYRISIILNWLQRKAQEALTQRNIEHLNAMYMFCIASIFWSACENAINYDIKSLITRELFESIYNLKSLTKNSTNSKYSLDSLLCSICYINPEFYPMLLHKMGVLQPKSEASISDDCKEPESMTDDTKCVYQETSEWYNHLLLGDISRISYQQLETIALVSRSPTCMQQLLNSGFPKSLNDEILRFCSKPNDTVEDLEKVIAILRFFTDVCDEKLMRDWLGSSDGSSFWLHLLNKLCEKPTVNKSTLPSEAHVQLEEMCVKFLSKCCLCHQANQTRLAKVLCEVIALQKNGMSGFLRRIILQLLLEYEKVPVCVSAAENLQKLKVHSWLPSHPGFKPSCNKIMLHLSTNTTIFEIVEKHIYFNKALKQDPLVKKFSKHVLKKEALSSWFTEDSDLSMAAGVTAKDKRAKDAKNQIAAAPQFKKKRYANAETSTTEDTENGGKIIKCDQLPNQTLSLTHNLSQLLKMIEDSGNTADWPCIHLDFGHSKSADDILSMADPGIQTSAKFQPYGSALQVFSSMGGLALLAQHLPTVYPEAIRVPTEKSANEQSDSDWIKVEGNGDCEDIYEDIEETIGTSSPSKGSSTLSHIPSHSLTAFGLFLRLPGYAELLLKDMKRALCLLRLVLGVTDDGEGGEIFASMVADSLPTLPFEILKKLFNSTPLTTDDGVLLRRISINSGVIHLLLACISIFTHHAQEGNDKEGSKGSKEERTQLYWAKGTGFGTGSTQQSWNVEQALLKQRSEEEHVTVLLQVLASYVNPSDATGDQSKDILPPTFTELLANSSLLPALSSYLKNDSVFDMARHIPLYKAVLQLLRAIASSSQLVNLLHVRNSHGGPSLCTLLKNMKTCVDTYTSKLRINNGGNRSKSKLGEQLEDLEQGEGLATLMPDIEETFNHVAKHTSCASDNESDREDATDRQMEISLEERYLKVMKQLQFSSYEMIKEQPDGGCKFVVSHHFESNARLTGEQSHPTRVKRIAQEAVTLSNSLPLSFSSSVFVRYDTSRLDVMKVLIIGPSDTPYANGCYEFDVFFPPDYPASPMMINLETTGHHSVRFNPNLYNDGKVCLSVLNTWHGRPEEKWNPQTSSFLQVLVSIQSLILVPEPYFNEPGYERARGTPSGNLSSKEYNLNVCQATVRWAMLEQIVNPCGCFKEIIHAHFYLKRDDIIRQVEQWVKELEEDVQKEKKKSSHVSKKSSTANLETFKSNFAQIREQLGKLQLPSDGPETEASDKNHTDTDEDMEKMVNDMCE
ncbi:unnamed protein product [Brassicogethes aeneus]|uniref:Dual E2 ubiquitin-conjugating enzyme/E3 ubiquitin-protein ligase BIRC6 n=1 Tax=Brassicogethes aeneus TaxID=1431903 RepID=A0A9P0FE42_BRAAE|nr:unnamed protein product [Brassicogethes aeneus]